MRRGVTAQTRDKHRVKSFQAKPKSNRASRGLQWALLCLFLVGCGKAELYHGLSEKEANEFIVRLGAAGIAAEKELEPADRNPTWMIKVEEDKLAQAFQILDMYGLPKEAGHGIQAIYGAGGLIPGQYERKSQIPPRPDR